MKVKLGNTVVIENNIKKETTVSNNDSIFNRKVNTVTTHKLDSDGYRLFVNGFTDVKKLK